jgi:hypothetical protein
MGAEVGIGKNVQPPAHLFEQPPVPKAPQVLSWDTVGTKVPGPQHTRLSDKRKRPPLDWGEVLVEVSHAVSKRSPFPPNADD